MRRYSIPHSILASVLCLIPAVTAYGAGTVTFDVTVDGAQRKATTTLYDARDVAYVSLSALADHVGGTAQILPTRIKVEIGSRTAWLSLNEKEVSTSRGRFTLDHPVLRSGETVLISLNDTPSFFQQAFGMLLEVSLEPGEPAETEMPEPNLPDLPDLPNVRENDLQPLDPELPDFDMPEQPLRTGAPRVIAIDPGHGGADAGAEGGANNLQEKDIALALAKAVQEQLKTLVSAEVILTRSEDATLGTDERARSIGAMNADVAVSLHTGAGYGDGATGVEVFYPVDLTDGARRASKLRVDRSRALGEAIMAELREIPATDRGVRAAPCRIFSGLTIPVVIVETGVLTTPADEALLTDAGHRGAIAKAVAAGIANYAKGAGTAETRQ